MSQDKPDDAPPALLSAALKAGEMLADCSLNFPPEVRKVDDRSARLFVDIDGVDYIVKMTRATRQRARKPKGDQ
jgi:hypothetical protein